MSRVVLRVEPQLTAEQAPQRQRGVSVAGVLDVDRGGAYELFTEPDVERLVEVLGEADLVVGHGLLARDYAFIEGYVPGARRRLEAQTLDLAVDLRRRHGRVPTLTALGLGTLLRERGGLPGAVLWQTARVDELVQRNEADVFLLRDLYLFGREHRVVVARREDGQVDELEVDW